MLFYKKNLHSQNYVPSIDGMRGIAILSVVFFHFFPNYVPGGFVGVDIFFVISGYLISNIIIKALNNGTFNYKEFFFRRIRRIFPALIIVLFSAIIVGWYALFSDEYLMLGKHILSSNFFILNFILINEDGYFDQASNLKPVLHLWSLSIEEQFYIIWPLIMLIFFRKKYFIKILFTIIIISFFTNIYYASNNSVISFYSSISRFWELLLGFFFGYFIKYYNLNGNFLEKNNNIIIILSLTIISLSILLFNQHISFPGWWALLPVVSSSLILINLNKKTFVEKNILSNKILVWFGLISYPLYLWHFTMLSFYTIIYGELPNFISKILLIIISISISWFTYVFIENPIRFGRNKQLKVYILLFSFTTIIFISYSIFINQGFKKRVTIAPNEAQILFQPYPHSPIKNYQCINKFKEFKNFDSCLLSTNTKNPEIIIIGDSHAQQYYKSFSTLFPEKSILNISQWSCLPFVSDYHLNKGDCKKKTDQIINFLEDNKSIKVIILTGYFSYLSSDEFTHYQEIRKPGLFNVSLYNSFEGNGERIIEKLKSLNKSILVIKDIPSLDFHPKDCVVFDNLELRKLKYNYKENKKKNCNISLEKYEKDNYLFNKHFNSFLKKIEPINIFDPKNLFCDANNCYAYKNNEPMYYNGDHLTFNGSLKVVKQIKSKYSYLFN